MYTLYQSYDVDISTLFVTGQDQRSMLIIVMNINMAYQQLSMVAVERQDVAVQICACSG